LQEQKKEYLASKIYELETNSKIKNTRDLFVDICDFKNGFQPRANMENDKKGDLVADSHSILVSWRNHLSQLSNVHGINDVMQREIHTAEPLVPEPSAFEFEMDIEKLKGYKSPGIE